MDASTKQQVRAGCYLRISSDPNDRRNGVDRQREDTAVMCEVQGWTLVDYYVDNNRSASNGKNREQWTRLLADIEAGKIDAIVAWNQDRAWRKMEDFEALRPVLAPLGVRFATTNIGVIDFRNPDDIFRVQVSTALSEMEIAKIRVRQLRAARQRAERGRPKWRRAFGYLPYEGRKEDDDGSREIDAEIQPLVVEAYERIVRGQTLEDICRLWNGAGKPGLNGKPWAVNTASLFLHNPRNAGIRTHNGVIVLAKDGKPVKGTWPPLVPMELWEAAQTVTKPGQGPRPKTVRVHVLTGVLWCGATVKKGDNAGRPCEGYLSGNWGMLANGGHVINYRCKSCRGLSVRESDVQPLVMRALIKRLSRPDAPKLLQKKTYDAGEAKKVRTEEAVLRAKLLERTDMLDKDEITREQFARSTANLREQLDALALRQQDEEQRRLLDGVPLGTDKVGGVVEAWPADHLRRVIAALMVVTVLPVGSGHKIFNKNRIKIAWT